MRAEHPTSAVAEAGKRQLPTVTLVAVTSTAVKETIAAMRRSSAGLNFAQAILLTHEQPHLNDADGIEWRKIPRLNSRSEYSQFMINELPDHIETEQTLCVQWDGFVVRPSAWSDAFLAFDFIGARWPQFDRHAVGNGGFSLRSRKLLKSAKNIGLLANEAEDIAICRRHRSALEDQGIRFAPPEVADLFSYERSASSGHEFGFHGIFNLPSVLGRRDFREFLSNLDPGLIGNREWKDLFKQSMASLDLGLAMQLLRNRILTA